MLSEWGTGNKNLSLFEINERWGIRNNSLPDTPAVLMHRCTNGSLGYVHDLIRNKYKCDSCRELVPDEVQALWLLRTCDEAGQYWMNQGDEE